MNTVLVAALLLGTIAVVSARPQRFSSYGGTRQQQQSGSNLNVNCRSNEISPGVFRFDCSGLNPTLSSEHILWLRGPSGESQQLDIVVPNYKVEELIRAALKSGGAGGSTNINILLKRPETIYDVQAQDGDKIPASKPVVSLEYESVPPPSSVHYPTEQRYNPLSGPIREP